MKSGWILIAITAFLVAPIANSHTGNPDWWAFTQVTAQGGDGVNAQTLGTATGLPGTSKVSTTGHMFGFSIDRVRLGVKQNFKKFRGMLQVDFADSSFATMIKDANMMYRAHDYFNLTVGKMRVPVGMEHSTRPDKLSLTKRTVGNLDLDHAIGGQISGMGFRAGKFGTFGYAVGVFNPATDSAVVSAPATGTNGGIPGREYAVAGKITWDRGEEYHFEAGYALNQRPNGDVQNTTSGAFIRARDYRLISAGLEYNRDKFNFKGEWIRGTNILGFGNQSETDWYAHIGYRHTRMWEFVTRYVDHRTEGNPSASVFDTGSPRKLQNIWVGVNAYFDDHDHHNKLMLNYVLALNEDGYNGLNGLDGDAVIGQWTVGF